MNVYKDDESTFEFELEYDFIETNTSSCSILSSNDFYKKIEQLVKITADDEYLDDYTEFKQIAKELFTYIYHDTSASYSRHTNRYLDIMIRLILFMRDINGFERTTSSFHLLNILSTYDYDLFKDTFKLFVEKIGSWKDVKNFYYFLNSQEQPREHKELIIHYLVQSTTHQLREDLHNDSGKLSLVSKWIPREKTKYNKLYELLVREFYSEYFQTAVSDSQKIKALNKAKMNYRKIIASLNKQLDTVQIKQCSNQWAKIDPRKQTSRTMKLQLNAFLNKNCDGSERFERSDRIICSYNFKDHLASDTASDLASFKTEKMYFKHTSLINLIHHLNNDRYD